MDFKLLTWIGLFLALAILGGVGAVVIEALQDSVQTCSDATAIYNTTSGVCMDPANTSNALGGTSAQYNATQNGLIGVVNYTNQLSSAGTIAGLSILVLAAVMILGYFGWRRNLR